MYQTCPKLLRNILRVYDTWQLPREPRQSPGRRRAPKTLSQHKIKPNEKPDTGLPEATSGLCPAGCVRMDVHPEEAEDLELQIVSPSVIEFYFVFNVKLC